MSAHPLAGEFSVEASAVRIRHYRYAEERLTRILGGWIALTPELPVKLLFGRHVWECAQHADAWGRRLPELRAPAQESVPSGAAFVDFMALLESAEAPHQSVERVLGVYAVLKPHLADVYGRHLAAANAVYEPPTRRILARCVAEERRHAAAGRIVLGRLLSGEAERRRAEAWEGRLLEALARARGVSGEDDVPARAPVDAAAVLDGDVVALDSRFDAARLPADLVAAVEAHGRALVAGDAPVLAAAVMPAARDAALAVYRELGPVERVEIVGAASVGAVRILKLRLRGLRGLAVVQQQWRRGPAGWQVGHALLVRAETAT